MSASWYDVLGVERDAQPDEIRAAWRASIADLEPTDRRFKLYNEAAGVLLDSDKRAEYDATLPPEEPDEPEHDETEPEEAVVAEAGEAVVDAPAEPADEVEVDEPAAPADDDASAGDDDADDTASAGDADAAQDGVPTKLLALLAVLVVVVAAVAAFLHVTYDDPDAVEERMTQARRAAEGAVPKVVAYDYKFPERGHDQAMRVLGGELKDEYDDIWTDAVEPNLAKSKATLTSEVLSSGLVRSSEGGERVQVLTILKVHAVNSEGTQDAVVSLTATMVERDGTWLVEELDGWDPGLAEDAPQEEGSGSDGPSGAASESPSGSATP